MLIARLFMAINRLSESDLVTFVKGFEEKRWALLRQSRRVPCTLSLDMAVGGRAIQGFALDIGPGGMFVESCERFHVGQPVAICFSVTDHPLALKLKGRVVRLEDQGVGIQFESPTRYQLEILNAFVDRRRSLEGR